MPGSEIKTVYYINPPLVYMRLTGNLKDGSGITTDTLSIVTKLDLTGLCLKYNIVAFDPDFVAITNKIKDPAVFVE